MSLIGTLTAGDGTDTKFALQNVPQIIMIADAGAVPDIEGFVLEIDGQVTQRVALADEGLLDVIAQLGHTVIDGANNLLACYFLTGNGYLENVPATLTITNADAVATPNVYGFSVGQVLNAADFDPVEMNTEIVFANQPKEFSFADTDYIVFNDANFSACDIIFDSGNTESQLTETELKTVLALSQNVPAGIESNDYIAIGKDSDIASIKLYASANMDVVKIKF